MEEDNVFTAKTEDEAIEAGLKALGITLDEAEITVIEASKKKLFGSVKAKVKVEKKRSEDSRAADFVNGLLKILQIEGTAHATEEDDGVKVEIKTSNSARVIGKRGDILDAIQCMTGAYANIGKNEYKKVVVDCENYRAQREQTLVELAHKLAAKAVESGRKMSLEPMSPYERRIIHAALMENSEVKTISEGREPARYIVVIPNNAKPYDKGVRYGERRRDGGRRFNRDDKDGDGKHNAKRGDRRRNDRGDRAERPAGGAKRGKKEIHFGQFLGNSNAQKTEEEKNSEE